MKELNLNLNLNQVLAILLRALDHIDVRLVDHGHRVAYIVYKMLQADGSYQEETLRELCTIASLHDIGAYKTEEIDQMMRFESEDVFDHSIYGYLFLKHMSPLKKWARIVLYHHLNYDMHQPISYEYMHIADMIHLADRIDVLLQTKNCWLDLDEMSKQRDPKYSAANIMLFQKANELYDIKGKIMNGSYLGELTNLSKETEYSEEILLEFIKMIAYSIDFRSETTVSHVITTVGISMELGKLLGLEETELRKIEFGAYLHDIGKISTPLEILEKPGLLTNDEMLIMKKHIDVTGNILQGRIHEEIRLIAFRHHEKIDGSGYPRKLKGEQLTLNDRIVAVADIMSALTGKRSYKESFPKDEVIEILRKQKESGQLCEKVTDTAIRNYDAIMESCRDSIAAVREMYENISKEFFFIKRRFEEIQ